jgi:hypothetical protein
MILEWEGDVPLVSVKGEVLTEMIEYLSLHKPGENSQPLPGDPSLSSPTGFGLSHCLCFCLLQLQELISQLYILYNAISQPHDICHDPIVPQVSKAPFNPQIKGVDK